MPATRKPTPEAPRWLRPSARSTERGQLAEKRVLEACRSEHRPRWLVSARYANRDEDRAGIDIVLESDIGRLYLQVKSSAHGKARFLAKEHKARIAIVVVPRRDPDEMVRGKVYSAIGELRAQYRRERPVFWKHVYES